MGKTCFIIDGDYPYSTGEPFLENEITYLCERFEKIIIFSYNVKKTDKKTRFTPANVISVPIGTDQTAKRYIKYPLYAFFHRDAIPKVKVSGCGECLMAWYQRGRSLYAFNRIREWIEQQKIDCSDSVIYSFWLSDHALTAVRFRNYLLKKGYKVRAVSRAHGFDVYSERNTVGAWPYQRYNISKLDAVYVCSQNGADYLKGKYPDLSEKIKVARLGTSDHGDKSSEIPSRVTFVTCSHLNKVKRVTLFAEAFCSLAAVRNDVRWVCIGNGEEEDAITRIVNGSGCNDQVVLKGILTNDQVIDYYVNNGVTYFCNVSSSEGVPVSIMEALSFGIPCIATDVGGTGELVNDNNGCLIKAETDREELATILLRQLSISDEEYKNKRRNARTTWEQKASAAINYSDWCNILYGQEMKL